MPADPPYPVKMARRGPRRRPRRLSACRQSAGRNIAKSLRCSWLHWSMAEQHAGTEALGKQCFEPSSIQFRLPSGTLVDWRHAQRPFRFTISGGARPCTELSGRSAWALVLFTSRPSLATATVVTEVAHFEFFWEHMQTHCFFVVGRPLGLDK